MVATAYQLVWVAQPVYHLAGRGYYCQQPHHRDKSILPPKLLFTPNQQRQGLNDCITYQGKAGRELFTGLLPAKLPRWFWGELLLQVGGGKFKPLPLALHFSTDGQTLRVFIRLDGYPVNNKGGTCPPCCVQKHPNEVSPGHPANIAKPCWTVSVQQ